VDHAEERADRKLSPEVLPGLELFPGPGVHPDLAPLVALPTADKHSPAAWVHVALGQRERFADPQACSPQHHDQRSQPGAVNTSARGAHHSDDLLDRGRVGGVASALVAR
jgi:hypothetical protein